MVEEEDSPDIVERLRQLLDEQKFAPGPPALEWVGDREFVQDVASWLGRPVEAS
jgi:hypothetical protein